MEPDYRARVYEQYAKTNGCALIPETLINLKPRGPYLKRLIIDHFPANRSATVLDLGCGHGALLYFSREVGYRNISGIDVSPEQVAAAHRLGIKGVEQGELLETLRALPDRSQDCIVAFDVIEHFTKQELADFVDQVYRALTSEGRWIIHVPNGESPFCGRIRYGDITHELSFTRESITQLLRTSGFSKIRCFEDTPIVHGIKSAIRYALWKMIRATLRVYIMAETGDIGKECIFSQNFLVVADK